jgi:glutathione peroxidase
MRAMLALLALSASACRHSPAEEQPPAAEEKLMSLYTLKSKSLEGEDIALEKFSGKVALLVNVASQCGLTPQYSELEALYEKYEPKGFVVLGFPSNDFGKQEPGSAQEIREFCSTKYRITFPMFEKVQTKAGAGQSPIYAELAKATGSLPSWNFGKYLIGRDGKILRFFDSKLPPDDPEIVKAVEAALDQPAPAAR